MNKMNFEETVSYLLNQVSTVYYSYLEKSLNSIGLHYGQVYVLIALWGDDHPTQKEIAVRLSVSPPTINKMVKSLEKNGFVELRRCEKDTRAVRVSLTEKGANIRQSVEEVWNVVETEMFSTLTDTEKLIMVQLLQKVREKIAPQK